MCIQLVSFWIPIAHTQDCVFETTAIIQNDQCENMVVVEIVLMVPFSWTQTYITVIKNSIEMECSLCSIFTVSMCVTLYQCIRRKTVFSHWFITSTNSLIKILRPTQNGRHFAEDIFVNEHFWITNKISPKYVPWTLIDIMAALVQIIAWRRSGDGSLSEPMLVCITDAYMRLSTSTSWYGLVGHSSAQNPLSLT